MKYYPMLMSPVRTGNIVFKNRLISCNSMPHFLQAEEPGPSQSMIDHLSNRAANGAALVTLANTYAPIGLIEMPPPPDAFDIPHMPRYNIYDKKAQNRSIQLADAIHFYGAKASLNLMRPMFPEFGVDDNPARHKVAAPTEKVYEFIQAYIDQAKTAKEMGYDFCSIHAAYGSPLSAEFLSRCTNHRTDEFGGSIEGRIHYLYLICKGIKQACGRDFGVEIVISGQTWDEGYTTEELGQYLKILEPFVDVAQIRMPDADNAHPTGFVSEKTPALKYSAYLKTLGLDMLIAAVGGFQDPDDAEEALASGKCDLIIAARAFICDFDYGKKLEQGRKEDIVPCVRCNKCHVIGNEAVMRTGCTVNPKFGLEHCLNNMVKAPERSKKIAVIGGGPAGMQAALTAAERGHSVTLYEKRDRLGGALIPATVPDFKWPLKDYMNYMTAHVMNNPCVTVKLSTEAVPAELAAEGYDAVIAAVGAEPAILPIPGVERAITGVDMFEHPEKVTGSAVIIGGGEIGVEAGIFLSRRGVPVTVLEMTGMYAREANRPHYYDTLKGVVKAEKNLTITVNAKVCEITPDAVIYEDKSGARVSVPADTVILSAGSRPKQELAMSFYAAGDVLKMVGDCNKVASVLEANRDAFAAASAL